IRLLFAAVILGIPTFLMGGTLPAAARAVTQGDDIERRSVGFVYGANTLGAVAGACAGTFYLFENFGNRMTLWMAAAANVAIAMVAFWLSRRRVDFAQPSKLSPTQKDAVIEGAANRKFVLVAAAVVG